MSKRKVNIWFALVLAWLVPGLGHFYAKRMVHGLFYFLVISGLYAGGLIVSDGTAVNATDHLAYFMCQILAGPITFGVESLRNPDSLSLGEGIGIMAHQSGTVYAATAGVLNLIVICELYRRHVNPDEPGPSDTMRVDAINVTREDA